MSIYKYCRGDDASIVGVIEECTLYFRRLHEFNDPYESTPWIKGTKNDREYLAKLSSKALSHFFSSPTFTIKSQRQKIDLATRLKKTAEFTIQEAKSMIEEILNEKFGIACLTRDPQNILMWSHYADGHRGFAVEFDEAEPLFSGGEKIEDKSLNLKHLGTIRNVVYSKQRKETQLSNLNIDVLFGTKAHQWEYEQECRVIRLAENLSSKNGILIGSFRPESVKKIIVGNSVTAHGLERIKKAIRNLKKHSPAVELHRMVIRQDEFSMDSSTKISIY